MFRRSKSETTTPVVTDATDAKMGGKGRPTPSRKEAQAAAKARAKAPRSRKEQMAAQRAARGESSSQVRQAMKTGDERFLPARDKGPVRRFIRDFVDSRFSFIELMVPLLIVTMILGYSGSAYLAGVGNTILLGTLLLVLVDLIMMRFRLRRELGRRFPGEPLKGTTYYAVMRALQMKFMRLPKAQVKIGQKLPEHYR
ncbi:MAG: integral rane protein [Acidimicrobiales bacterium]|nr:integral rane protein [Acidimicrobiales bacterium]